MTKLMLLCAATIALTACEQAGARSLTIPDSSCAAFKVINPSTDDTMATKRQVLVHNTIWRKLCAKQKTTLAQAKRRHGDERPSR